MLLLPRKLWRSFLQNDKLCFKPTDRQTAASVEAIQHLYATVNCLHFLGYADVKVTLMDINDNDPLFPSVKSIGTVKENSAVGTRVMTMSAMDYDDPAADRNAVVRYDILRNVMGDNGQPIFEIDPESGVVKTAWAGLDRERVASYSIVVRATDGGGRTGTGTASIELQDENDSPPKFQR